MARGEGGLNVRYLFYIHLYLYIALYLYVFVCVCMYAFTLKLRGAIVTQPIYMGMERELTQSKGMIFFRKERYLL